MLSWVRSRLATCVRRNTTPCQSLREYSRNAFHPGRSHDAQLSMNRRVLVMYMGGTLGMNRPDALSEALDTVPGYLTEQLQQTLAIQTGLPECDIVEWPQLLDSSNVGPEDWVELASKVFENYYDYDGFVVLHGTDTMAYSAAAVSYMLQDLGKPVVFTGSQIPFCDPHNDARRNVLASILVAGNFDIPEVCIYFNDKLLRGTRATKRSTSQLDAFDSPNFPILGESQIEFKIREDLVLPPPRGRLVCHKQLMTGVTVIRLVPGFDDDDMITMMKAREQLEKPGAIVLMLYGTGGAPDRKQRMFDAISRSVDAGTVVVVTSQCPFGSVDLGQYAVSGALRQTGVISAGDMTIEAIVGKLSYLMGRPDLNQEMITSGFCQSLRGDRPISSPPNPKYHNLQSLL